MKIIAIIPARLDSSRLPQKQLKSICGNKLLYYMFKRLQGIEEIDEVILATTERDCDNPLVEYAQKMNINSFRGDLDDVLGRFLSVAKFNDADIVIRANGDCPLIAPEIISKGLKDLINKKLDFVTGKNRYTDIPVGLGAEIITFDALQTLNENVNETFHKEHVTSYIFEHANFLSWKPISKKMKWVYPEGSIVVDDYKDLRKIKQLINGLLKNYDDNPFRWKVEDIISTYKSLKLDSF